MNMKKMIAITLTMVLLILSGVSLAETYIFPVEPATPTGTDISMSDAISIAKNEVIRRQGLSLETIENYTIKANFVKLENNEYAWVVMLDNDEELYGTDVILMISSVDAKIIDYQATNMELATILIDQWKKRKGAMKTWSLEDQALFNFLYGFSDEYVVPGENHISQEDATSIALSAIPQSLSSPEFSYCFQLFSYTDGRPDQYVWLVTIFVGGKEKYLVHVSATDGAVIEVFSISSHG